MKKLLTFLIIFLTFFAISSPAQAEQTKTSFCVINKGSDSPWVFKINFIGKKDNYYFHVKKINYYFSPRDIKSNKNNFKIAAFNKRLGYHKTFYHSPDNLKRTTSFQTITLKKKAKNKSLRQFKIPLNKKIKIIGIFDVKADVDPACPIDKPNF